jgi:hypothetical protein
VRPCEQVDKAKYRNFPGIWELVFVIVLFGAPALYPLLAKPLQYEGGLAGTGRGSASFLLLLATACAIPFTAVGVYVGIQTWRACNRPRTRSWFAWRLVVLIVAVLLIPVGLEVSRAMAWREGNPFLLGFHDRVKSQFDLDSLRGWARNLRNEPIGMVSKDRWPQVVKMLDPAEVDVDGRGNLTLIWGGGFERWGIVVAADETSERYETRPNLNIGGGVYVWESE